jgi:hypothetical protein
MYTYTKESDEWRLWGDGGGGRQSIIKRTISNHAIFFSYGLFFSF